MDATEVIDSYVHDVARRLPVARRGDVAMELRSLLTEELESRARAEAHLPDRELATALVREFGRPAEVAVRYYRPFTIIEPSDTWSFVLAAIVGALLIVLLAAFGRGSNASRDLTQQTDAALLGWLGVLVVVFGLKSLILRYRPHAFAWNPRPLRDSATASRLGEAGLAGVWLVLLVCYLIPGRVAEFVSGGRIDAGTLVYTGAFSSPVQMPWLIVLLAFDAGIGLVVAVRGHWRPGQRWGQIAVTALIGGQLGWAASRGAIFDDPRAERIALPVLGTLSAMILIVCAWLAYQEYSRVRLVPAARDGHDSDAASRLGAVGLAGAWLVLLVCYLIPGRVAEFVSAGRVEARTFTYTASFTSPLRMSWLIALLVVAAGVELVVAVRGRWRPGLRWAQISVTFLIAMQLGWHVTYGAIFDNPRAERFAVPVMGWLSVVILVACGWLVYREYIRKWLVLAASDGIDSPRPGLSQTQPE
jgi:hypothetical protein